jgi:hypothetical protein
MFKCLFALIFTIYIVFFTGILNSVFKYVIEKYIEKKIKLLISTSSVTVTIDINLKLIISVFNLTVHKPTFEMRFKQPIILTINESIIILDIISIQKLISNRKLLILDSVSISGASVNIEGRRSEASSKRLLNIKLIGGEV